MADAKDADANITGPDITAPPEIEYRVMNGTGLAASPASGPPAAGKENRMIDFQAIPTCEDLRARLAAGENMDSMFESHMPREIVGETVSTIRISDSEMKRLVAFLACSAQAFDWDATVPDAAGNLFASAAHRTKALVALDALAKKGGSDGDAAGRFAKQMRSYNFGPNG